MLEEETGDAKFAQAHRNSNMENDAKRNNMPDWLGLRTTTTAPSIGASHPRVEVENMQLECKK